MRIHDTLPQDKAARHAYLQKLSEDLLKFQHDFILALEAHSVDAQKKLLLLQKLLTVLFILFY
jgi:hypothetical protein